MNKQPDITARTRRNLEEAFWQLFATEKLRRITVNAIVKRAGYHRSTFYLYYPSVDDLISAAEDRLLNEMMEVINQKHARASRTALLSETIAFYERYGLYLSRLMGPDGDPGFRQKYKEALRPVLTLWLPEDASDAQIEYLCEYGAGGILSLIAYWYDHPVMTAQELAEMIADLVTHGVPLRAMQAGKDA